MEDVVKCYEVYGWYVVVVDNGDFDFEVIDKVIKECQVVIDKFFIIKFKIIIGFGFKQQGIYGVYGVFFKVDDIEQFKEKFGFNFKEFFVVFQEVYDIYGKYFFDGVVQEEEWNKFFVFYKEKYFVEYVDLICCFFGKFFEGWEKSFFVYIFVDFVIVFCKLFEIVLGKIEFVIFEFVGGFVDFIGFNSICWKFVVDF